jgi:hypothetical protein
LRIGPYGLLYEQTIASSLVKIDVDGNILDETTHKVNRAGFVIHSAADSDSETRTGQPDETAGCDGSLVPQLESSDL